MMNNGCELPQTGGSMSETVSVRDGIARWMNIAIRDLAHEDEIDAIAEMCGCKRGDVLSIAQNIINEGRKR